MSYKNYIPIFSILNLTNSKLQQKNPYITEIFPEKPLSMDE